MNEQERESKRKKEREREREENNKSERCTEEEEKLFSAYRNKKNTVIYALWSYGFEMVS